MSFKVVQVKDLKRNPRRSVVFLTQKDKSFVNGWEEFEKLPRPVNLKLRRRFELWIEGHPLDSSQGHGWNKSEFGGRYTTCFVFKARSKNGNHHVYGFLVRRIVGQSPIEICVLAHHYIKSQNKSDETILSKVVEISKSPDLTTVINEYLQRREKP